MLPADFSFKDVSNTSFTLSWSYDEAALGNPTNHAKVLHGFLIYFTDVKDTDRERREVNSDTVELTISNLLPSTEYNVSISVLVLAERNIGLVEEKLIPYHHSFLYISNKMYTTITTKDGGMRLIFSTSFY